MKRNVKVSMRLNMKDWEYKIFRKVMFMMQEYNEPSKDCYFWEAHGIVQGLFLAGAITLKEHDILRGFIDDCRYYE